jgi:AmmeMemoRadiSam system protein B
MWYPQNKRELDKILDGFFSKEEFRENKENIHGIIVPHAGYAYSGQVAGKAYSILKQIKPKKAIILSPSHYFNLNGAVTHNDEFWTTALGKVKIIENSFRKAKIKEEHAIDNQIPFLQKIGVEEILPLVISNINLEKAREIAEKIKDFKGIFIVSSDLSHFHPDNEAKILDRKTIKTIENLDSEKLKDIDACGFSPILVLMQLCKIKGWKPKLLEYKNSGDITGDKERVVGYCSMIF